MSFPLRAGDSARVATYVRAGEGRVRGGRRVVVDPRLRAVVSGVRPYSAQFVDREYGSCCDEHLVAATAYLRPGTDRVVTYTVRSRVAAAPGTGAAKGEGAGDGGDSRLGTAAIAGIVVAAMGLIGSALALRARARRRRRRRPRRRVRR